MNELIENIDLYLSGKHDGTKVSYGSFLYNFMSLICEKYGWETASDLSIEMISESFEQYCLDRKYKDTTVRSFRYGLKSYLRFLDIDIGPFTLLSSPWEERIGVIQEPEFDLFLNAVRSVCKRNEEDEIVLISCLAYHCGLTLNEILKLSSGSFYKFGESYRVHVTGVSDADKERVVEIPEKMKNELLSVIEKNPAPLFTLGRRPDASDDFSAVKRKLQRTIRAASECMAERSGRAVRYDLRALRSSRIYTEIMSGRGRKDIMETYGVSEYYISHILKEKERL